MPATLVDQPQPTGPAEMAVPTHASGSVQSPNLRATASELPPKRARVATGPTVLSNGLLVGFAQHSLVDNGRDPDTDEAFLATAIV